MDLKDIKELVALMRRNDLSVFKFEQEGFKITLKRGSEPVITTTAVAAPASYQPVAAPIAAIAAPATPAVATEKFKEITSPMVGTFYASPAPDAQPFVKVGSEVASDTVVCIIEAMKVMNEIKAEIAGTIVEVVAEIGKPVQYGQVLYRVRAK